MWERRGCVVRLPTGRRVRSVNESTRVQRSHVSILFLETAGTKKLRNSTYRGYIRVLLINANLMIYMCYIQ